MDKNFVASVIAISIASLMLGFVVHGVFLHDAYAKLPNLFRPETQAQGYFGYMLIAHLLIGTGFTWIYRRGRENKPWLIQGLRFGAAVAVMMTIPTYLIYFAVQPLPSDLVAQQIVFDLIAILLLGIFVAWLNKYPAQETIKRV